MNRWTGLGVAAAASVLWFVLADRNPSNTYHFAPAIVAAAWVVVGSLPEAGLVPRVTIRLAAAGFVLAVLVTIGLEITDRLQGPVFWQDGDDAPVVVEHVLFAALGAVGGGWLAVRRASR